MAQDREQKINPDLDLLNWLNGLENNLLQLKFPQDFLIFLVLALSWHPLEQYCCQPNFLASLNRPLSLKYSLLQNAHFILTKFMFEKFNLLEV